MFQSIIFDYAKKIKQRTINFYNEEKGINKRDWGFVLMLALSLITKHILFMLPVFIFFRPNLPFRKKCFYMVVPVAIFICSFLPFTINHLGFEGVLNNVFLYRSFNNAPLFYFLYNLISFPNRYKIIVYMALMIIVAFITRKEKYDYQVMFYLIAMVAFSSAIANQYLVIPMVALCVFNIGNLRYLYMILAGAGLVINGDGLGLSAIADRFPSLICNLINYYDKGKYIISAWTLFIILIFILLKKRKLISIEV